MQKQIRGSPLRFATLIPNENYYSKNTPPFLAKTLQSNYLITSPRGLLFNTI